jgi:hypothetical protein
VPNWQSTTGYIEIDLSVWPAYDGKASADLSPYADAFLFQTVDNLVAGHTYELSFALRKNPKCGGGSDGKGYYSIAASVEGVNSDAGVTDFIGDEEWKIMKTTFTASSETYRIGFGSSSGSSCGPVIDSISLKRENLIQNPSFEEYRGHLEQGRVPDWESASGYIETMGVNYYRIERESIYHPATIGDIPFEVIQKALRLLIHPRGRQVDLVSASLASRAWSQAAAELIVEGKSFYNVHSMVKLFCGMQLKTIVCGFDQYPIKKLELCVYRVGEGYIRLIAKAVSSSLSFLILLCGSAPFKKCYEVSEVFFSHCSRIDSLRLQQFDFGVDPSFLTLKFKDGLRRLKSLDLIGPRGDKVMFDDQAPISSLSHFNLEAGFGSNGVDVNRIISLIVVKCRSLKCISIRGYFSSRDCILTIVETFSSQLQQRNAQAPRACGDCFPHSFKQP